MTTTLIDFMQARIDEQDSDEAAAIEDILLALREAQETAANARQVGARHALAYALSCLSRPFWNHPDWRQEWQVPEWLAEARGNVSVKPVTG
jgi:hypothetical protein